METQALNRLRWLAIAAPVAFLVTLEVTRGLAFDDAVPSWGHVLVAGGMTLAAVAFAVAMFRLIGRSQEELRRRNRDLGALTSVSGALRDAVTVEDAIESGVAQVLGWTGASDATVTLFPSGDPAPRPRGGAAEEAPGVERIVEIPLRTATAAIGRLDLHFRDDETAVEIAPEALRSIGEHLGCSIRVAQLVEQLRRSRREEHGLYDLLLGISGREPLGASLACAARQARDLLNADEASVHLEHAVVVRLLPEDCAQGARALADGSIVVMPPSGRGTASPHPAAGAVESLSSVIRGGDGILGEIWVTRHEGAPFTTADRRLVSAVCELASLAVTTAQARGHEVTAATVAERERIAREMHDGLAQALGVIHLRLRALGGSPDIAPTPAAGTISDLAEIAEDAYRDVREALLGLRESSRADRGLLESLRVYLEKFSRQSGIATTLEAPRSGEPELTPQSELQLIRVVQEALANARKHSGARSVVVRIVAGDEETTFIVEDDGSGFTVDDLPGGRDGFGLQAMRERMDLVGGTLTVTSAPGEGTRVVASCPRRVRPALRVVGR